MPKAELFTELTNLVDVDPFALLGISVSADEKRIVKRYRQIAKQLHPDALTSTHDSQSLAQPFDGSTKASTSASMEKQLDPAIAAQVIARIVNPSYQKLKHENGRQEMLSTLRFRVRRLSRTEKLIPTFHNARTLANISDIEVDIFYEQALSELAQSQFRSIETLHAHALEISQLNLVFLLRKMENVTIRAKRTGLIINPRTPTAASSLGSVLSVAALPTGLSSGREAAAETAATAAIAPAIDYAHKHTIRAITYLSQKSYGSAIRELREALKLTPQNPELHSMIGQVYYKQNLSGMAKTHFRQALKLKPTHQTAQKYGKLLGISAADAAHRSTPEKAPKTPKRPWIDRLLQRSP